MKNKATPLAAALVLAASIASAQSANTGSPLFGPSANPFGAAATSTNSDPDWVFKCGTPPFIACTTADANIRENIRITGKCPTSPASQRCADYLMKNGGGNPLGNYSAMTPPTGYKWKSPDCTRIPCQIEEISPKAENNKPSDHGNGEVAGESPVYGPPCPTDICGPKPFADDSSFKEAMAAQEEATPGKVIDLGNRTYAVDTGDGKYSIGGLSDAGYPISSYPPKSADQIPGLKKALDDKAQAEANANMFTGASAGGDNKKSAPTPGPTPAAAASGGVNDGASVVANQDAIGAKGTGGQTAGSGGNYTASGAGGSVGGSGGGSGGTTSSDGGSDVLKVRVDHREEMGKGYTFIRAQKVGQIIESAGKDVEGGRVDNVVNSAGEAGGTVQGRAKDPDVDPATLGKQKWSSQK